MAQRPRPAWVRYGAAILTIAVAALIRYQLDPYLDSAGFSVFFVAVVIASWYGGLGPSLVALVLSLVTSAVFFGSPPEEPPAPPIRVLFGLGAFFFVGVVTALLSQSMRAAQRRAEAQAEDALRQHEQLRTTLACIGDAVIVTDQQGRLTMMNMVAEHLTGWKFADAKGQPVETVFQILDELSRQPNDNPVRRAIAEGTIAGMTNHTILISKDGGEHSIDDTAAPIRDSMGAITGAVLIFRDVTKSRQAASALREADRRKDEFLAMLAHELRNPLAPICTALELLRNPATDPMANRRATEVIDRQVHQLVRLVDDLLDVSRIMRGKIELRPESLDLNVVISRAIETVQPLIDSQGHQVSVSVPDEGIVLNADPIRLTQIVTNLLTNAAKYTDGGGQIWVTATSDGACATIRVRDTGVGIPKEMLPQVFQLFTQVDSSVARSQGGLGIGLTLVKSLVEIIGGNVEAHSEGLGKGSEFVVTIPIHHEQILQHSAHAVSPPHQNLIGKWRVLVVDDNADAAETLTMLMQLNGHEVEVAHDGATALERAPSYKPDIIFLDLGMPLMDGLEVARRLRHMPQAAGIVLVALTGWGSEEDRQRSREAGFDFHLVKPVTHDAIDQLLTDLQLEHRSRRQASA